MIMMRAGETRRGEADQPATYYHATGTGFPPLPELIDAVDADVCVIGGGLTGVSAALNLAERGCSVILLEAERVGFGASGRNGGQLVSGYSCEMATIRQQLGTERSKAVWAMGIEALDDVDRRINHYGIRCDRRSGYLFAACNARQMRDLEVMLEDWDCTYGYDRAELLSRDALRSVIATDAYVGGVSDPGGGQLHPLNYLYGLARAGIEAGVRMFETSRAVRIKRGRNPEVHTPRGRVRSNFLVLAGNAYFGGLVPELQRTLACVTSFIGTTQPLDPALIRRILPMDVAVSDCNVDLDYYRTTSDGRLLWGAGANYAGKGLAGIKDRLQTRITRVFPELRGMPLDHAWSGRIGITASRIPDFGCLSPTVYYAHGFSGHGMALTGLAGKLIAEAIHGDAARFNLFGDIRHRPFPGGPLRTAALMLAMTCHKLRDRLS